ncbi:MAG TPA: DUF5916 domain-containing protein [Candidatus Eremiobacteraceae bacterium]|nr:DUF5916 domain-containing protein [Candidatus Eremiobacteraceae bacterium]
MQLILQEWFRRSIISVALALVFTAAGADGARASVNRNASFAAVAGTPANASDTTLADPVWQKALVATGFEDLTTRIPAPLATSAYLLYDAQNVYVAFHSVQPASQIHAGQTTNNIGFGQDDFVGVGLDPSGNGGQVYYFETTPRGVRYQQASESTRYDPPWQAFATVQGDAWNAVLVIPLKVLRASGGHEWRFTFIRGVAAVGEHYTWVYDGVMQDAQPPAYPLFTDARFWPALTGIEIRAKAARPQPRAELYGLESVGRDRLQFQQANGAFARQSVRNYGLDFTYPLTNTVAAVGTLNPDFSNVEVDQQTISPQEFRRNLNEYRPFFAQGAQYFSPTQAPPGSFSGPGYTVFYTPSIGTFDRGLKVEGTYGLQSIGALNVRGVSPDGSAIDDTAFGFGHSLTDRTFLYWADGVLAHHDIGDDTTIESGFKGRNLQNGFVYGFNQALETRDLVTDSTPFFAYERNGFVDVHKPNYEWTYGYEDISPGYNPLDGITPFNDARGSFYALNANGTWPGVKTFSTFMAADRFLTRSGIVHSADYFGNLDFVFPDLIHVNVSQSTSELNDPFLTGGASQPFNATSLNLGYRDGTPSPIDASYSAGPFANFYLHQFFSSTSRSLGTRFNLSLEYDGNFERFKNGSSDGQLLRRVGIGESFGPDTNISIALRSVNGTGGFSAPGVNLAVGLHERFPNTNELFINFGTPAANTTLDRLIVKYLWRIGGGAGT